MDLVVDANILFAALIKESTTNELLFLENLHLFTPEYILTEIENHKEEILAKTSRSPRDFSALLDIFKRKLTVIPLEELKPYVKHAEKICPDPDDLTYIALALKLKTGIWSNDRTLKEKQNDIRVYTTAELVKLFL